MQLYAGLGCRRGCPAHELAALLEQVLLAHDLPPSAIAGLASIELKRDEPGLQALAVQLGIPLVFFCATQLAPFENRLSHRSPVAYAHSGCHGVAESAALALAEQLGGANATLRVPRTVQANATLALAWAPPFDG